MSSHESDLQPSESPSLSPNSSASSSESIAPLSSPPPHPSKPSIITLDLILRVLQNTFLHPFIAWLVPLCLRAQATPYTHSAFILTTGYAALLTLFVIAVAVNKRVAYGAPREVDWEEEVVLVTGGRSGIGRVIAESYGMRGVSVAVLDVRGERGSEEMQNVRYYRCDVGDRAQVEEVARRVEEDVSLLCVRGLR